ncbi:TPA: hypothetical protein SFZ51_000844 [Campylobacter jejuni]|uniref:Uncharacterized protein n=1 Tax=Campylobacter jejuni TaxID=197 RepID=A0A431E9A5_CAMJU|nr:hypothetical protein C3H57_09770 [Campylobacter jejuni]HEG8091258.1 hypothetical protein [Campylobacter jejuni]HEG8105062.1 hypothetical protein [Campylobacter jejuni]HEG8133966.1 hypothetical protein [Campylobacter jejuni]
MSIISSIRLFILDPCTTGCSGCSLGHKVRDKAKVHSNYLRVIDYLNKTSVIQVSDGCNTPLGDELEIALESSDLLTSNPKFLLSPLFQDIVRVTTQSFRHVELANNGALTKDNWGYLKILSGIVSANKIKIEISTPGDTYYNGEEIVNIPENDMNGVFLTPYLRIVRVKLHRTDNQYDNLFQIKDTDLEECCEENEQYDRLRKYYHRHHNLSLRDANRLSFVHDSDTFTLLVSDLGVWLVPEVLSTAKFLFSTPIQLNDTSVSSSIAMLKAKYKDILSIQDELFRSHMVDGGCNYRDPKEIAKDRLSITQYTDKIAMSYLSPGVIR